VGKCLISIVFFQSLGHHCTIRCPQNRDWHATGHTRGSVFRHVSCSPFTAFIGNSHGQLESSSGDHRDTCVVEDASTIGK
jgi:hypothetical protein